MSRMAALRHVLVGVLLSAAVTVTALEDFGDVDNNIPLLPSSRQRTGWRQQIVQPFEKRSRTPDSFPFLVHVISYRDQGAIYCAGAVIGERYVLTAAHCLSGGETHQPIGKTVVVAGRGALSEAPAFDVVDEIFYSPSENERVEADVVILKVYPPMPLNQGVERIPLQNENQNQPRCFLVGWTSRTEVDAQRKEENAEAVSLIRLSIGARSRCISKKSSHIPRLDLLCVGRRRKDRDTCKEQPGSPLVCNGLLAGLAAGGRGCAVTDFALSYASTAYYAQWIQGVIQSHPRNMTRHRQGPLRLVYSERPRQRPPRRL